MNSHGGLSNEIFACAKTEGAFSPVGLSESTRFYKCDGAVVFVDGYVATDSDCQTSNENNLGERLIDSYRRNGLMFLEKLRGSFRLGLWDVSNRKLLLAVDPFGTRSLYYTVHDRVLIFGPRIRSFRQAHQVSREVDPNAIYFYLNHSFVPAPLTVFQRIKRLEPGHVLIWDNGRADIRPYWDMNYVEDREATEESLCARLRSTMAETVRFHMRDLLDGPHSAFGAFLSGGVDSSTLLGLMTQLCASSVNSFSVGFSEERYNELFYARVAARRFHSESHECIVKPSEAVQVVAHLGKEFDEPFGNSSALPTYFCLRTARETGVKVMFAGDGGDELFGGNERYAVEKTFMLYHELPTLLRKSVDLLAAAAPSVYPWVKVRNYVRKSKQAVPERFFAYQLYMRDNALNYFTDDFRAMLDHEVPLAIPRAHYQRSGNISPLNRLLYMDLKLAIADNDLFKVNRMAEALGVEVRYPFLDKELGRLSGTIPARLKLKGWQKRYIFKKAFKELLPQEIIAKKKHGFGLPTGDWLRSDPGFRELARSVLLDSRAINRGYFQQKALENLFAIHDRETDNYYGSHIWNLLMLEFWHRNYVDA